MEPSCRANYDVIRQLGEGGMGRVYEAVHRPSGRVVAIKTLRTEHGASSSQRLLLNEAVAAAQLAHPGIVELLDVGRDDRGGMFLVMELVRGSSLEAWSSFPGLRTVLRAFQEILAALAAAHAQGIVHGDLKPGNVLLTADGRVKLTDFGIAHVMDPLRKTERRGIQGTPYYMAPEQLLDATAIGPSTDLYAIGVMLYELVAGTEPYAAEGTLAELLARKLGSVRPLEARAGLEVPPALAALVMELLDPSPRTRPRFAARVRGLLADFLPRTRDEPLAVATPLDSLATIVTPSLGTEPTIHSSDQLPMSHPSSRSLPFSLPCAEGSNPAVALHRLRPLPLVGRSAEAERLLADAARVAAVGGACGVIVSGRAGEGKTRLVRHGFAEVERAGTMLGAAASFDETIANAQVGLHACITRLMGAPAATLADSIAGPWGWLRRVPQPGVDFARIHEWLTSERGALDAAESADVASTCVLAASRVFPIYLWLDDVAWSRDGAMELFVRLLERDDARVLVIGTLRSGTAEHPEVRAWLLRAAKAGARLEMLPALDAAGRARLIAAAGGLALGAAEALAERLDEPPLVLVETVRAWIDEGDLVAGESGYVVRDGAHAADLATRAAGTLLARRIDKLLDGFGEDGPRAERVLAHAALLGLRFEERVLRACAETEGWVDRVLDRALLTGLLRVDGRGAYRFEHRLFLDTIVERCRARADADAIHCATANAIVSVYGSRALDNGLAVATLYRAGRRREAAVRRLGETIRALARSSLFDAVDRALALFAGWNEADTLPPGHLHEALLDVARGHRAYFALDYDRARAHLEAAYAKLEALGAVDDSQSVLFDSLEHVFLREPVRRGRALPRVARRRGGGLDDASRPIAPSARRARGNARRFRDGARAHAQRGRVDRRERPARDVRRLDDDRGARDRGGETRGGQRRGGAQPSDARGARRSLPRRRDRSAARDDRRGARVLRGEPRARGGAHGCARRTRRPMEPDRRAHHPAPLRRRVERAARRRRVGRRRVRRRVHRGPARRARDVVDDARVRLAPRARGSRGSRRDRLRHPRRAPRARRARLQGRCGGSMRRCDSSVQPIIL